ncbi:hypothetical protein Barb6XT_01938 [Bacteroidales bacterium Barb6XT]|nr:hypothetical protein Barb6XT_01938 [Bacteroidales bacterium Barb6XT]
MDIVFIGAGNLATRLSLEMQRAGLKVRQVYSRTEEGAKGLAEKLDCDWTCSLDDVRDDAGLYIFAVKDAVLEEVILQMKPNGGLWVHTAGSIPMGVFEGYAARHGVFYPLQTFSKEKVVAFCGVPVFLEASSEEDGRLLECVAGAVSGTVRFLSSEKRRFVHLAGVFAGNFSNYMYAVAAKLLEGQGIGYEALLPLIIETAGKVAEMSPSAAQTGPAVRFDENVMALQESLLEDGDLRELYRLISRGIYKDKTEGL